MSYNRFPPAGGGGGSGTVSGTTNRVAKFTAATVVGNANWAEVSGNIASLTAGQTISVPGTGVHSEQFGLSTSASADGATVVGYSAQSTGQQAVALGFQASAEPDGAVAIGVNSHVNGGCPNSVAIGPSASIGNGSTEACAVGPGATSLAGFAIAMGSSSTVNAGADYSIAMGYGTQIISSAVHAVALGYSAYVANSASYSLAIGSNTRAGSTYALSIGADCNAKSSYAVAIGQTAVAETSADYSVVIGNNATSNGQRSIMIGAGASSNSGGAGYCIAIGDNAQAGVGSGVSYSMALGVSAFARADYCTALGFGVDNGTAHTMALGGYNGSVSATWCLLDGANQAAQFNIYPKAPDYTAITATPTESMLGWNTATHAPTFYNGTSWVQPVADGTYTMGIGVTTNGTITIVSGVITAIQEAS